MKNQEGAKQVPISKDKAVALIKDVFTSAAERDIYTGDGIKVLIITKTGITEEKYPLRRDQDFYIVLWTFALFVLHFKDFNVSE